MREQVNELPQEIKPPIKREFWLHVPTFTFAIVNGDFGKFYFNKKKEESYWGIFREEPASKHGWVCIGDMN